MKTVTYYVCEVCQRRFYGGEEARDQAMACEARAVPQPFPVGLIFGDHRPGAFCEGMTFCVAQNRVEGHVNYLGLWACRPRGNDSLGDELCGSQNGYESVAKLDHHLDREHPTFKRMAAYLRSREITPLVWNGKEVEEVAGG